MKKLLALLLVSPLATSDFWAEFIEAENLQLTHIACEHSGEKVNTMLSSEVKDNISQTDYFLFNEDYFFVRLELMNFETQAYVTDGETYEPPIGKMTVTINNEAVKQSITANQEGLEMLSNDKKTYKNYYSSITINRLTGTIKTTEDMMYYAPSIDANGYSKTQTTGLCSLVTDKKKF
jgi:hypothetical protein